MNQYLDGEYAKKHSLWHQEDSFWKAEQVRRMFKYLPVDVSSLSDVCEVGCGAGKVLFEISQHLSSCSFDGFDISPQAIELGAIYEKDNLELHVGHLSKVTKKYDLLLCLDVVEHVENYIEFLKDARSLARFHIFHFPLDISCSAVLRGTFVNVRKTLGHLHFFSSELVDCVLQECGYRIIESQHLRPFDAIPARKTVSRLLLYPRQILSRVSPVLTERLIGGCSYLVLCESH